ncbi:MAG: hypothetical protein IKD72_09300 [Clostridia bacterium]|nr:hypothetical protein [Clostridia bacterium]
MIDPWSVLFLLRSCYQREEADDALLPLCAAAAAELDARLRADADPGDVRLLYAAAMAVYHRLCLRTLEGGQGVTVFKAGDVTVNLDTQSLIRSAAQELERARAAALPLLRDDAFFCGQVTV